MNSAVKGDDTRVLVQPGEQTDLHAPKPRRRAAVRHARQLTRLPLTAIGDGGHAPLRWRADRVEARPEFGPLGLAKLRAEPADASSQGGDLTLGPVAPRH